MYAAYMRFRVFLSVILIFSGVSYSCGMTFEDARSSQSASSSEGQIWSSISAQSVSNILIFPSFGYCLKDSNLIDLVFLKALSKITFLMENGAPMTKVDPLSLSVDIQPFLGGRVASISPENYLVRIKKYFGCPSAACYVLALLYIEKIIQNYDAAIFNQFSFYRLFLTALVIATKFGEDLFFSNELYAKIGGIPPNELTDLEARFLSLIASNLYVSKSEYDIFVFNLKSEEVVLKKWFLAVLSNMPLRARSNP
jgi:hypothetical protein